MKFYIFLITFSFFLFCTCKKYSKPGMMPQAGIALTFDDNRIDNWHTNLNLLDSLQLKATFYISGYKQLTPLQKQKLLAIKNRGHEIGYHTLTHKNLVTYEAQYNKTFQQMMEIEIKSGMDAMKLDGYNPQVFAYPYGAHNSTTDEYLYKKFKSVRALNGSLNYAKSLTKSTKNKLLYALGLDRSSNNSDELIERMLVSAKENNNCLVLVAHNINSNISLSVNKTRLIAISKTMQRLQLKTYLVSEISE